MKTPKNETRYIPQPLKELLQNTDYNRIEDLYVILDLIYRKQVYFKNDLQKQYGFVEISKKIFSTYIPNNTHVYDALNFLVGENIIIRNDFYIYGTGARAKGYKISKEFLGTKAAVEITCPKMNARIKKEKLAMRKNRVRNLEYQKSKYYKTFQINSIEALQAAKDKAVADIKTLLINIKYRLSNDQIINVIDCSDDYIKSRNLILSCEGGNQLHSILHRLMIHQQQIYSIADGWLFFKRNQTNGRLDTNLTSLPSYLRKFIISDNTLVNIDIKNSQPYFLYTKLRNEPGVDKSEVETYGQLAVTGELYEYLGEKYKLVTGRTKQRDQIKKMLFSIFYSKVNSYPSYKAFFRGLFPTIMDYIDGTNGIHHNTLAVAMQTMESHAILDVVMPACKEVGIIPLTVHDSFIVNENEAGIVREIFEAKFLELFELVPSLHYESLLEATTDETEDALDDLFFLTDEYDDNNQILETTYLNDKRSA